MIWKYTVAYLAIFGLLAFLKHVEDSPVRSWKGVFLFGIPLSIIVCFWLNWAAPAPPPPETRLERVAVNKAEMIRTLRRIDGVDRASIDGPLVLLNFSKDKPLEELKKIARNSAAATAHFLEVGNSNRMTFRISVHGHDRYEMEYDTREGFVSEKTF